MKNRLADIRPELVGEWSERNLPLTPAAVTYGSNRRVWWKGTCGHEWEASVKNRVRGSGCPYCSHRLVKEGINDLASRFPQIAAEWSERNYPLLPTMVTAYTNRKIWWRCKEGHEWKASVSDRSYGSGCPVCAGRVMRKGFNDLVAKQPQLVKEWSEKNLPLTPDQIREKSRKNVWWKCRICGWEWKAVIHSRVQGSGCPVCGGRAVLPGYNDLASTAPYLLDEWDYKKNGDLSPEHILGTSRRTVWWKCPFGHSWKGRISERVQEKKGCEVCEKEYRRVFLRLAVCFYAAKKGLKVCFDSDEVIGIPIEMYLPEESVAVETFAEGAKTEELKEYLCGKRGIRLIRMFYREDDREEDVAGKVREVFESMHFFFSSDVREDVAFIRKCFDERRNASLKK
ncbi:MAG: zinc-ribbon domain-containing protein [Lachnospiraceae bacterium]|nr:zinc-ribbon domain-containing protein [Lachnospiraceae bacterium]